MKLYPYKKGGTKRFEVVLTQEFEALAILKLRTKSFHPYKRGGFTLSCGGCKKFSTRNFPIL